MVDNKTHNIIAFGASLSANSINKGLATYAGQLLTQKNSNFKVTVLDLNNYYPIPIFSDQELKKNGVPELVKKLDQQIKESDGLIISLAENNFGYTAGFKNILDWLSRAVEKYQDTFHQKPLLLTQTSPSPYPGQVLGQALHAFPHLGAQVVGSLAFPNYFKIWADNKVSDEALNKQLSDLVDQFAAKVSQK